MSDPINDEEMNLRRLAKRFSHLSSSGMIPFPDREGLTIIVKITNPQWAIVCLRLLLLHCDSLTQIVAVPGKYDLPSIHHLFTKDDPITFWQYESGVDLINKALSEVSTPFAALLEDRVLVTPQWLSRLIWPFYDDESVMIASPKSPTEALEGRLIVPCQSLQELWRYVADNNQKDHGIWRAAPVFTGSCLLFRKSLLDVIGEMDPQLRGQVSRIADWCLRARQKGYKLALCEDVYVHALHPLHSYDFSPKDWEPFCSKWGLREMDTNLNVLTELEVAASILLPSPPLRKENFSPPLITAIVLIHDDNELERWFHLKEEQTYVNVHWILIRNSIGFEGLPFPKAKSAGHVDAIILLHEVGRWKSGLEAALKLAKGEYIVYMSAEQDYARDYIERMVDLLFRESSDIVLTVNKLGNDGGFMQPASETLPLPLHFTAHRHTDEIGSFLDDTKSSTLFLLPHPSLRTIYWNDGKTVNQEQYCGGREART